MKEIMYFIALGGVIVFTSVLFIEKMTDWYVVTIIKRTVKELFRREGVDEFTIDISKELDEKIANTKHYKVMIGHLGLNGQWYTENHIYEMRGLFNIELLCTTGPHIVKCYH